MTVLNRSRGVISLLVSLMVLMAGCSGSSFECAGFPDDSGVPSTLGAADFAAVHRVEHLRYGSLRNVVTGGLIPHVTNMALSGSDITSRLPIMLGVQATYAGASVTPSAVGGVPGTSLPSTKMAVAPVAATSVTPTITWTYPRAIRYGTPLSSSQLNARTNVPGTLVYTPAVGAVLRAGARTISVLFTPKDTTAYTAVSETVPIQINQVVPTINWPPIASIEQGTALSITQLNATSNVFGTFTYHPGAGTVLPAGTQNLAVSFSPNDTTDYSAVMGSNSITVNGPSTAPLQPQSCGGPTVYLQNTMSTEEIQSAIGGAPNCSLILFAAGTYKVTSSISIPCPSSGLTISGPAVAWPGPYQVTLNGSVAGGWGFAYGPCASPVNVEYLEWNGGEPAAGGGGFMYVAPATSNLTIQNNFIHGNQANVNYDDDYDTLIWFDGDDNDPPSNYDNNNTIQWNIFGNSNDGTSTNADCGVLSDIFYYQGGYYDQIGGYCAAIALHSSTNNFTVNNNIIQYQEEGFKLYEGGSVANQLFYDSNLKFAYNDLSFIHRIAVEGQQNANPTMNFNFNDLHDEAYPAWSTWGFSLPEGGASNCENNVLIANTLRVASTTGGPGAVEFWGSGSCNNNLVQGYWGAGMQFGFGGAPWTMDYNVIQQLANTSYINNEENINCCYPEMLGNAESQQLGVETSAAPTISLASTDTASSGVSVTLMDTGATNGGSGPQGNTTIYYTTDGSTPTTSSTVCNPTPGSNGCIISVATGATIKAIGMWGSINQPKSYPTGYGFVPSAVVTASF
jgi:hypothetical protein